MSSSPLMTHLDPLAVAPCPMCTGNVLLGGLVCAKCGTSMRACVDVPALDDAGVRARAAAIISELAVTSAYALESLERGTTLRKHTIPTDSTYTETLARVNA